MQQHALLHMAQVYKNRSIICGDMGYFGTSILIKISKKY